MKEELNIAAILKEKPRGLKLWSDTFGEVYSGYIDNEKSEFPISISLGNERELILTRDGRVSYIDGTLPCIVPSKQMRDWSKFAWKKGDVLVNSRGLKILFDRWANDNYTSFYAKTINLVEDGFLDTNLHTLASEKEAKSFIKCIEKKLGGKLNRETLKIEKAQPEFKDGDIVALVVRKCTHIAIFQSRQEAYIGFHAVLCQNDELLLEEPFREDVGDIELRPASDSEKQQFFDALAKKGKTWDAEKKAIVDLPKKCEFKAMDWCLMRDKKGTWNLCQFSFFDDGDYEAPYNAVGGNWFDECIPYNEETKHLLGTTDEWKGGDE